jgi:hypothetical protein
MDPVPAMWPAPAVEVRQVGDAHQRLARGVARQHPRERLGRVLESVDDRLAVHESALGEPAAELAPNLGEAVQVAAPAEAAQRQVVGDRLEQVARALGRLRRLVLRDGSAQRHPPPTPQSGQRRLQMVARDVVEVDVDSLGCRLQEVVDDGAVPIVERRVQVQVVEQVADLGRRARTPDHAVTAELGDLGGQASHRAGRRRHPDNVPFAQSRGVDEPRVGSQPHPAERPEVLLRRRERSVDSLERAEAGERRDAGRDDGVVAPARRVPDGVARDEPVGAGLDHFSDRHDPVHRRAQEERVEVAGGAALAQPQPHAGVHGRERVAHEHLAGARRGYGDLHDAEVGGLDLTLRVVDELHLAPRASHRASGGVARLNSLQYTEESGYDH